MFLLSISIAGLAAAISFSPGYTEISSSLVKGEGSHHAIVMFGASWCAPCIAELRNIAAIASSASPDRIVIAWSDGGITRYILPVLGNVEIASGAEAQRMARQYAPYVAGLPYSVMTDRQGRKCGEWKSFLTTEAIGQMRTNCLNGAR